MMAENETRMLVLLMTDIVGSLRTKSLAGTGAYARTLKTHDALFRQAIASEGGELLHDTGDGFLAGFETASRAVRCALRFQHALRTTDWEGPAPAVRVGLHAGEVTLIPGEGRPKIVGLAADLASRVNHLAIGGQILMTRAVYDEARQFVREHPGDGDQRPTLSWHAHHAYRFKGMDQTVEIFEVGAKDLAPLIAPPDAEKAERHASKRRGRPMTALVGLIIGGALAWWIFGDASPPAEKADAPIFHMPEPAAGPTLNGHTDTVWATAFSPDGMHLISGSRDQTLRLWHSGDGRLLRTFTGHTDSIHAVAFSLDGHTVASASNDKTVRLWSIDQETEPLILSGHTDEVDAVAFAPHGQSLATGSKDATVRLWDLNAQRETIILEGHTDGVWTVAYSPDGHTLASAGKDRTLRLWDPTAGQPLTVMRELTSWIFCLAFSPDGRTIASGSHGAIKLWDAETGQVRARLEGHDENVYAIDYSPDGRWIASASKKGDVQIWDTQTHQRVQTFTAHTQPVTCIRIEPRGRWMSTASRDQTVRLWSLGR